MYPGRKCRTNDASARVEKSLAEKSMSILSDRIPEEKKTYEKMDSCLKRSLHEKEANF